MADLLAQRQSAHEKSFRSANFPRAQSHLAQVGEGHRLGNRRLLLLSTLESPLVVIQCLSKVTQDLVEAGDPAQRSRLLVYSPGRSE